MSIEAIHFPETANNGDYYTDPIRRTTFQYDEANTYWRFESANLAASQANTVLIQTSDRINIVYGQANSAYNQANAAFNQANTSNAAEAFNVANNSYQQGRETVVIPAASMNPRSLNGASLVTYDPGNANVTMKVLAFDAVTQEFADIQIAMPKSWNRANINYKVYWTTANGKSGNTISWLLQTRSIGDNSPINGGFGTAVEVTDTVNQNANVYITVESANIAVANTPNTGDLVAYRISRNVANDNLFGDAYLISLHLYITANSANDS